MLGRRALSPLDLEREFGLVGGDIFHGALALDQLFSARPVLGHADYRMPVAGLYLCGAGAHPGGGVTGIPGRNAAREIVKDVRRRRLKPMRRKIGLRRRMLAATTLREPRTRVRGDRPPVRRRAGERSGRSRSPQQHADQIALRAATAADLAIGRVE